MQQTTVYAIGETVFDIIFKDGKPVAAKPGGSSLNAAVSLGRMKVPVEFISEFGSDESGRIIAGFLEQNHVSSRYSNRFIDGKTHIALAFLDQNSNARYSFYTDYPEKRFSQTLPMIRENDIILFGSLFSVAGEIRSSLVQFLTEAKKRKAIIYYDPNFRKSLLPELPRIKPMILENMALATVIRGSDEDFEMIFGTGNIDEAYSVIGDKCKYLIYTQSDKGVSLRTPKLKAHVPAKKITPVSTIGAGDNFNAGFLYSLYRNKVELDQMILINEDAWKSFVNTGIDFASEVCMSMENYISEGFASSLSAS